MKFRDRRINDAKLRYRNLAVGGPDTILTKDDLYAKESDDLYNHAKAGMFIFPKDMGKYISNSEYFGSYQPIKNKPFSGNVKERMLNKIVNFDNVKYSHTLNKIIEIGTKILSSDADNKVEVAHKFLKTPAVETLVSDIKNIQDNSRRNINSPFGIVSRIDETKKPEELEIDEKTLNAIKKFKDNYYYPILNLLKDLNTLSKQTYVKEEGENDENKN